MRLLRAVMIVSVLLLGQQYAAASEGASTAPYLVVRSLKGLQDRIAAGDPGAAAAHARALASAGQAFSKAKASVWSDQRNARALALYLFSGGNASLIAEHVGRDQVAKDQQALFDGALAYALGRDDEARATLMSVETRTLPAALGGHLALVQASLISSYDKDRALVLLDLARLLTPGSLVEEAALRKELLLLGTDDAHVEKFSLLARRYAGTFQKSIYADNFRALIRDAARSNAASNDLKSALRLTKIVASLDQTERRQLYLAIAREALLAGRLVTASFAAEEAGHLARAGEKDDARAKLYFGAAAIVGARYDHGLHALQSIDETKLDARDRTLRQAALSLGDMVRRPSFVSAPKPQPSELAALDAGERALDGSADLLKRANQ